MSALDLGTLPLTGIHLLEASAGTGKTHALTTLFLRLLVERDLGVGEILVVTFTKAATAELKDRIRRRLRQAAEALAGGEAPDDLPALVSAWYDAGLAEVAPRRLTAALRSLDEAAIFTIHGFCQRALADQAFESAEPFENQLLEDEDPLLAEIAADFWSRETYGAPEVWIRFLDQRGIDPEELTELARRLGGDPRMPVLPGPTEAPQDGELEAAQTAWVAAQTTAAELWLAAKSQILELLPGEALKRNVYRAETIRERWVPALESALASASAVLPEAFNVDRLTPPLLDKHTKKGHRTPQHPFFDAMQRLLAAHRALEGLLEKKRLAFLHDFVAYLRRQRAERKAARLQVGFDDLLIRLRNALEADTADRLGAQLRGRYRAALVDEFQDTDPLQYDILRRLYPPVVAGAAGTDLALFLIGDPKQAIFAFRGADVFAYAQARRDAGGRLLTLAVNWRSGASLVKAVNSVFSRPVAPFVFDWIPFVPSRPRPGAARHKGAFEILFVPRPGGKRFDQRWIETRLPRLVAAEIAQEVFGGTAAGDIAVLCRTNEQVARLQDALREVGVRSVLEAERSVFTTPEAVELARLLTALAEPGDQRALRAALATDLLGIDAEGLLRLDDDLGRWEGWGRRFREWHYTWRTAGLLPAFRRVLSETDAPRRLLAWGDGERRLTNLRHLVELLHQEDAGIGSAERHLARLKEGRGPAPEAAQLRLESDRQAVRLVTIHKSKGLEYPIVFCPYLWESADLKGRDKHWLRFHHPEDKGPRLDLGSESFSEHRELARQETFAEGLRLAYVALTRARRRCVVLWGAFPGCQRSPLGYLLHPVRDALLAGDPRGLMQAVQKRLTRLSDDGMRRDLQELAAAAGGAIRLVEPMEARLLHLAPPPIGGGGLTARQARRRLSGSWRTASFSSLAAAGGSLSVADREGRDLDRAAVAPATDSSDTPVPLAGFPAGIQAGYLVHDLLEHADYSRPRDGAAVRQALATFGFESRWDEPLGQAIESLLTCPLTPPETSGAAPLRLTEVPAERRLHEMEFLLPVAPGGEAALTGGRLRRLFTRHGAPAADPAYGERLGELGFKPLSGFLKGFIDLVFEHRGRWYVVDFKSNLLGPRREDYSPERLARAMSAHHYHLQAYLYSVALHRHLRLRLPGYTYDGCFGGCFYLFLRGMDARGDAGVYAERPPAALIEELSALFEQPREAVPA